MRPTCSILKMECGHTVSNGKRGDALSCEQGHCQHVSTMCVITWISAQDVTLGETI